MRPPMELIFDWVRTTDAHASYRLPLLERAERILAAREEASADVRDSLSRALERWRYQHLNHLGPALAPEDQELADTLDLAANDVAGRPWRSARAASDAICDPRFDPEEFGAALECRDEGVALEEVTQRAEAITRRHFAAEGEAAAGAGRRMHLYAPLYLSSHCVNYCAYCGFRYPLKIPRRHLSLDEAVGQAEILRGRGFRHILLVAGDFPRLTSTEYYARIIAALAERGLVSSVEIAPQTTASYAELAAAGAVGVTLYQETYQPELYARYHPHGTKASFPWRLEGIERAAEAGMRRLGLGILLGLADPRDDLLALVRHGEYLRRRFPHATLAFSLPRIHQAPQGFDVAHPVGDESFVRLYCALRVAFPRAELVLSTRERAELRNRLARICITQISAGSSTAPGGYVTQGAERDCAEQFPVSDHRTPAEVRAWLEAEGFAVACEPHA